jgi:hypothetical protein
MSLDTASLAEGMPIPSQQMPSWSLVTLNATHSGQPGNWADNAPSVGETARHDLRVAAGAARVCPHVDDQGPGVPDQAATADWSWSVFSMNRARSGGPGVRKSFFRRESRGRARVV